MFEGNRPAGLRGKWCGVTPEMIALAACAGACGALVGGNGVFVMYGFAGLGYTVMQACGADAGVLALFNEAVMGCFLLPCVIFNGACAAAGYAGAKGRFQGNDINHSLASLGSAAVLAVGAVAGVLGYLMVTALNAAGFPADTGAVTVVTGGVIIRLLADRAQRNAGPGSMAGRLNERERRSPGELLRNVLRAGTSFWAFQVVEGLVYAGAGTAVAYAAGNTMIGFYVAAALILLLMVDMGFQACHHTVLIAAYALAQTGSFALAVALGLVAHLVALVLGICINTGRSTHLDPPAITIATMSLAIFCLL